MLEADTIKQVMKKIKKENLRRTRKLLQKKKQYSRNLIKGCPPPKILGTILEVGKGRT